MIYDGDMTRILNISKFERDASFPLSCAWQEGVNRLDYSNHPFGKPACVSLTESMVQGEHSFFITRPII